MKIVKSIILICFLFSCWVYNAHAQEVVTTAGGTGTTTAATVTWTIGETITESIVGSNVILTQGFNQGDIIITAVRDAEVNGMIIKVFPNPASDIVNITADTEGADNMKFILLDIFGRKIREGKLVLPESQLPVSELKPGIYFLKVYAGNRETGIYRIIKK
ncbi:MAG: T9SS type A sorting domain-containing protein [Bacteroidales bacterium]